MFSVMMVKQNIGMQYKHAQRRARHSWRKSIAATPVYRTTESVFERKKFTEEQGPTFLKVYAIPVLLLNLVLVGWDIVSAHIAQGWSSPLGYAVIVTVSLYLYLAYLDHYLNSCRK